MKLRTTFLTALLLLAPLGCAPRTGASSAAADATRTQSGAATTQPDLSPYFKPYPAGAFVLYDLKRDRYLRHDEARCRERFSPYSTFKIPNSLIGLDTGVLADAGHVIRWDEKKYPAFNRETLPFSAWWEDQTLRNAFRRSVVWYYRELALKVGERRMKEYVDKLDYGNEDASGPLNGFWLNSTLKISADEQVEFLKRLYREELPVSKRSLKILKEVMTLEETPGYRLSGKTGGGPISEGRYLGWFVGYLETKEGTYIFATEIEGPTYLSIRDERVAVTKRILAGLGHLQNRER